MLTRDILLSIACLVLMLFIPVRIWIWEAKRKKYKQSMSIRTRHTRAHCEHWSLQKVGEENNGK